MTDPTRADLANVLMSRYSICLGNAAQIIAKIEDIFELQVREEPPVPVDRPVTEDPKALADPAPVTEDPKALAEYLVRLAFEAYDRHDADPEVVLKKVDSRIRFGTYITERMNNAAQTITNEVGVLVAERNEVRAGLDRAIDVTNERDGLCAENARLTKAAARAERAEQDAKATEEARAFWEDVAGKNGERAERAEAGLAAVHAAYAAHEVQRLAWLANDETSDARSLAATWERVEVAFADTAQAAEAYRASVRAEALEAEAADVIDESNDLVGARAWDAVYGNGSAEALARRLRARAADERGGR